jgi:hypothetical protein
VVANVGARLTISKQETQKLGMARFILRKKSGMEFRNKTKLRSLRVFQV